MNDSPAEKLLTYRRIMALAFAFGYFHWLCPAIVALDLQKAFGASAGLIRRRFPGETMRKGV